MTSKFSVTRMLMPAGIFIISLTPVIARYTTLSDGLRGVAMGIGLGLLILALIRSKGTTHAA